MDLRACVLVGLACSTLFGVRAAHASGGYSSGSFNVPLATRVDREQYEIGRRIYTGVAVLEPNADDSDLDWQLPLLSSWQDSLPPRQQRKVDLTGLAGRLSPAQVDALGLYLSVRFAIDPLAA